MNVTGQGGVPGSDVAAVAINLATPSTTATGYITGYADGTSLPGTATINTATSYTASNMAFIGVGGNGLVDFYNSTTSTQLVGDVVGYFLAAQLTSPLDQARSAGTVNLSAVANSSYGYVTYYYNAYSQNGGTNPGWTPVPTGEVTYPGTTNTVSSWPLARGSGGAFPTLVWQAADTVGQDSGDVQVEACVTTTNVSSTATCSPVSNLQLTPHAFGGTWATDNIGPGTLALTTGDFQVSPTDASLPSFLDAMDVSRSFDTVLNNHLSAGQQDVELPGADGFYGSASTSNANVAPSTAQAYTGSHSLAITASGSASTPETFAAIGGDTGGMRLGMLAGHSYVFTSHIYVPAATGLPNSSDSAYAESIAAIWHIAGQASTSYSVADSPKASATNTWQTLTVHFTVPNGADQMFLRLYNGTPTAGGTTVYFDGTSLVDQGVLGPGWNSDLPGAQAGDADATVGDYTASQGYLTVTYPDGTQDLFLAPNGATSSTPVTYKNVGDAQDGTVLTKNSATQFTMTDPDGTQTIWTQSSQVWQASQVIEAGSSGGTTTSYTYNSSGQVTQIVGPAPPGVSCSTAPLATVGCRTLTLNYAAVTTATGTGSSGWGDYAGQLSSIAYTAADPANNNVMTAVTVAQYQYDSAGYLRQEYDPRISPNLDTTYSYDPTGRLSTIAPPGEAAWTLSYDSQGRLASLSRAAPSGPTAATTVAYGVPFTGDSALPDLSGTNAANWAQTADLPVTATAVFRPDHVPGSPPTDSDWPYATIHYLDVNGRQTNTAGYGAGGWQFGATSYDQYGNILTDLTADNRSQALNTTSATDPAVVNNTNSATRAQLLSTLNTYSSDGTELLDTLGPTHPVVLSGGSSDARTDTTTSYDAGAPNGDVAPAGSPYRLKTAVTSSAQTLDGVDHDAATIDYAYTPIDGSSPTGPTAGWTLRSATQVTTVLPGGTNTEKQTEYNSYGQTVQTRMPSDTAGTGAGTSNTSYYSATGTGSCVSAAMAGLECQTAPAAQPADSPPLPVTTTSYNLYASPTTVTDTSGSTTRTTVNSYDGADRPTGTSINDNPTSAQNPLPATTISYDPNTGLPSRTATSSQSITTTYDSWGQVTSYTDAAGTNSTSSYDLDGRPTTVSDGQGTDSYTYDGTDSTGNTEHRGLLTNLNDSAAGQFSASYNPDGNIASETWPNGLVATRTYNNAGEPTQLVYKLGSTAWAVYTAAYNSQGQIATQSSPLSSQVFNYDGAQRLTQVGDTTSGACTTRTYSYDVDSNRTSQSSYPPPQGSGCSTTTTPTTSSHSYDSADRATDSGYAYDAFGNTTTVPSSGTNGSGALSFGYYTDNMVASETQGSDTMNLAVDPATRIYSSNDSGTGTTTTDHYSRSSDSPAWQSTSNGTWNRFIDDITGNLAAIQTSSGGTELQLSNLHGDIVATAPDVTGATGPDNQFESTEFGIPRQTNNTNPEYAWLGAKQRSSSTLSGLVLMGERLYDPYSGRFLETDPVAGGGCTDSYDYANQDPINKLDLDGTHPKKDIKQFNDAVRECERIIGYRLTKSQRQRLHQHISGQNMTYHGVCQKFCVTA